MSCGCSKSKPCDKGCQYCTPCAPAPCPTAPKPPISKLASVLIDCETAGFVTSRYRCGCTKSMDIERLWAYVRRLGQCEWFVRYPAWGTTDDGRVEFRIDDTLLEQPSGRYEVEFRYVAEGGCSSFICGRIQIVVPPWCGKINKVQPVKARRVHYPEDKPAQVTEPHMYSEVQSFTATLCAVIDVGVTTLPLSPADIAALCAITLCKPVELVLDDGVNTELVSFSGCVSGAVVVQRGVSGTTQKKFPKGTSVYFRWTNNNVANVLAGCA